MEYKETLRAVFDGLVADIYKVEKTNFFFIFIYKISENKKTLVIKKIRPVLKGQGYQSIRDEIREQLFQEAYYKTQHGPQHIPDTILIAQI